MGSQPREIRAYSETRVLFHRSPQQTTSRPSFSLPLVGLLEDSDLDLPSLDDLFSPVQERRDVTISSGSATVNCGSGSYRPSLSQKVLISTTRNFYQRYGTIEVPAPPHLPALSQGPFGQGGTAKHQPQQKFSRSGKFSRGGKRVNNY